jgi:hypothetical protein
MFHTCSYIISYIHHVLFNTPQEELLVCNWPHSVGQNHFFLMMFNKQGFRYLECFQKILHSLQVRKIRSFAAVQTT